MSEMGIIIQARLGSKRFPGKVLSPLLGKPLLQHLLEGLANCRNSLSIIVATSDDPSDRALVEFCNGCRVTFLRGPLEDVAGRFKLAVETFALPAFVRISGDSPLLDYRLVDRAVELYLSGDFDLATNVRQRTFPKGQSVEVIRSSTFLTAYPLMKSGPEQEHVTPFFYTHPDRFSIVSFESGMDYGQVQLSVDTPEDMKRIERLLTAIPRPHWEYTYRDLVEMIRRLSSEEHDGRSD